MTTPQMFGLLRPPDANSTQPHAWNGQAPPGYLPQSAQHPQPNPDASRGTPNHTPSPAQNGGPHTATPGPGSSRSLPPQAPSSNSPTRPHIQLDDPAAHLRLEWEHKYAKMPMPPPPPGFFQEREELVSTAKAFAEQNGYALVIGHSTGGGTGDKAKVWLVCELAGIYRNRHKLKPDERKRNRASRKTDCPMRVQGSKYEFGNGWLLQVKNAEHNHGPIVRGDKIQHDAEWPDLEQELFNWHKEALEQGQAVHGNTIKAKAIELWNRMPQYQEQPLPDFTMVWINDYRRRYGFEVRTAKRGQVLPKGSDVPANMAAAAATIQDAAATAEEEKRTMESLPIPSEAKTLYTSVTTYVKARLSNADAAHDWSHILRLLRLTKRIYTDIMSPPPPPPPPPDPYNQFAQFHPYQGYGMSPPNHAHPPYSHPASVDNTSPPPVLSSSYDIPALFLSALMHPLADKRYLPQEQPDTMADSEPGENQIAEILLERGASEDLSLKVQTLAQNMSPEIELKNPRLARAMLSQHAELAILLDAERLEAVGAVGIGRAFAGGGAKGLIGGMRAMTRVLDERTRKLEVGLKTEAGRRIARERAERIRVFKGWWDEECAVGV